MNIKLAFPTIILDTEYTTFWNTRETGWTLPYHHKEIVQIAAIKTDENWDEIEQFQQIVKPKINAILTPEFVELTNITQERLEREWVDFETGLRKFIDFIWSHSVTTFDRDWFVFQENCRLNGIDFPFLNTEFLRVKERLQSLGVNPHKPWLSSGTLYQEVGIDMQGHVHDAMHDVRSMAAFLRKKI
jgi:inhibitor of KinA sporulation pathway (predicted exonuclease)